MPLFESTSPEKATPAEAAESQLALSAQDRAKQRALNNVIELLQEAVGNQIAGMDNLIVPVSSALLLAFPIGLDGKKRLRLNEFLPKLEEFGITNLGDIQHIISSEVKGLVEAGLLDDKDGAFMLRPASPQTTKLNRLRTQVGVIRKELHDELARISSPREEKSSTTLQPSSPAAPALADSSISSVDPSLERARQKALGRLAAQLKVCRDSLNVGRTGVPAWKAMLAEYHEMLKYKSVDELIDSNNPLLAEVIEGVSGARRSISNGDGHNALLKLLEFAKIEDPEAARKAARMAEQVSNRLSMMGIDNETMNEAFAERFNNSITVLQKSAKVRAEKGIIYGLGTLRFLSALCSMIKDLSQRGMVGAIPESSYFDELSRDLPKMERKLGSRDFGEIERSIVSIYCLEESQFARNLDTHLNALHEHLQILSPKEGC